MEDESKWRYISQQGSTLPCSVTQSIRAEGLRVRIIASGCAMVYPHTSHLPIQSLIIGRDE